MRRWLIFENPFAIYLLKFLGTFVLIYGGIKILIGLSIPGGYYSQFVHDYFDVASWLRNALLYTSKFLLSLFGYKTYLETPYILKMVGGRGIHIVFSCLGYGIMSFWAAFVYANTAGWKKKLKWIPTGLVLIFCINELRISLFLLAINLHWHMLLKIDNHTFFTILAYSAIFTMMYFFDKSNKKEMTGKPKQATS